MEEDIHKLLSPESPPAHDAVQRNGTTFSQAMTCFGSSESLSSEDFGHDDDDISNFSSDESCINVREPYTQAQQWNELTEPPYLVQSLEPMIVSPSSWNPITKTSQPTVLHQKSHPPRDVADRSPSVSSVSPQHSHYTGEALLRKMARGGTFADEYIQRINFKEPWPYDLRGLYQPHPIAPLPKSPSQSLPSKLATALSSLLLVLRGEVVERKRLHNSQIPHPPWGTYSFRSDDDDLDWDDDDGDLATWLDRVVHRNKRQYETCLPGVGIPLEDYEERSALSYTRQIDDFPWEVLEPPVVGRYRESTGVAWGHEAAAHKGSDAVKMMQLRLQNERVSPSNHPSRRSSPVTPLTPSPLRETVTAAPSDILSALPDLSTSVEATVGHDA